MNFRQKISLFLLLYIGVCSTASAQVVEIPNQTLRAAIAQDLGVDFITKDDLERLQGLTIPDARNLTELTGLEFAKGLTALRVYNHNVTDLSPIQSLIKLEELTMAVGPISDISPLSNLTNLKKLNLDYNKIEDITPLTGLIRLEELYLPFNQIHDVSPLARLTALRILDIQQNSILDHSPIAHLKLDTFLYDSVCDLPSLPVLDRIANRDYPSIITAWAAPHKISIKNRPDLSGVENVAKHDLWFSTPQFGLKFKDIGDGEGFRMAGVLDEAIERRDEYLRINPNMVFLVDIRHSSQAYGGFPDDWPYWIRHPSGEIVDAWEGEFGLVDFTHPDMQEMFIQQAVAVSKCGLYDGIFIDSWNDLGALLPPHVGHEAELEAKIKIMRRIRELTRPDFLIMVNANRDPLPITGQYVNGSFMETVLPGGVPPERLEQSLAAVEDSLPWLEANLRAPRINALEGTSFFEGALAEAPDSPTNLRWMRAFTTFGLTHSDGYVLFESDPGHGHYWYDFWDADLGRPVGKKGQLYQETDGLYIREFTNGWAMYNHSGKQQAVNLPGETQGVSSGWVGTTHVLPNLDGEMYLRVKPTNPADVNGDGAVNILDLVVVAQGMGTDTPEADVNGDGVVNVFDLVFVANQF